jgi:DNA-binding NtrC family response regulator
VKGANGKRNILVIEDDPFVATVLSTSLERAGYGVCRARGAEEAMRLARSASVDFHLLLSDVVLDGSSALPAVREILAGRPDRPVLFISGFSLPLLLEQGHLRSRDIDEQQFFFLQKPFLPAQLTSAVERVLTSCAGMERQSLEGQCTYEISPR